MTSTVPAKGLRIDVYRNADTDADYTMGGITATHTTLTLVGIVTADGELLALPVGRVLLDTGEAPAVVMVITPSVTGELVAHLEPAAADPSAPRRSGASFGGNFAGTSDSRFTEVVYGFTGNHCPGVLPVHDRYEY